MKTCRAFNSSSGCRGSVGIWAWECGKLVIVGPGGGQWCRMPIRRFMGCVGRRRAARWRLCSVAVVRNAKIDGTRVSCLPESASRIVACAYWRKTLRRVAFALSGLRRAGSRSGMWGRREPGSRGRRGRSTEDSRWPVVMFARDGSSSAMQNRRADSSWAASPCWALT
jgi:hypothetical protein